jgi:hypothetical protein
MTTTMPATAAHRVVRYCDERGFVASCQAHGWRTCRQTRELRDQDADVHELESAR